jgi:aspartate racemase
MRLTGILGGMGPEATILLMQRVLAARQVSDDAGHVPLLVHNNTQVPSRMAALIDGTGADPAPVLVGMAQALAGAGAQALAMPCNTAHAYAPAIKAAVDVPFLDMVSLTADALAARLGPGGRVGFLASPAVRLAGVFDAPLRARGLVPVWPQDEAPVLAVIRAVKAGTMGGDDRAAFVRAAEGLLAEGKCDIVLVACTELSLLAAALPKGLPWIDSLDVLVAAIVDFATGGN